MRAHYLILHMRLKVMTHPRAATDTTLISDPDLVYGHPSQIPDATSQIPMSGGDLKNIPLKINVCIGLLSKSLSSK